jgi:acyl carrier protein
MVGYISSVLEIPKSAISTDATFDTYGLDSAEGVIMAGVIEEEFGIEVDPSVFFEDPTVDGVAAVIVRLRAEKPARDGAPD